MKLKKNMKKWILTAAILLSTSTSALNIFPSYFGNECFWPNQSSILLTATNLNPSILMLALRAYHHACKLGIVKNKKVLSIIDYSLPSSERRLWVIDLEYNRVLIYTYVAHGKGSGANYASYFSDRPRSDTSSIGTFLTEKAYIGKHGYSLRLKGLVKGFNDKAEQRDIVIHTAWYVSHKFIKEHGRLGRSWGCPTLEKRWYRQVINDIKDGSILFIYYPEPNWLKNSPFLKTN